ncbi:hypothetical protein [Streptomyces hawaiiensis]|uniref:hypothetical protein n=1 Tax=Streptomyces hawaiiensis TaxID=67305 RepID=UPI00365DB771
MEPYKKTVDACLRADLEAPRKQRHTVRRIVARIEEEFGEAIPYPTVPDFVTARRKEIAAQAGAPVEAFVTRHNSLGADAEVDFGDVYVDLAGQRTRCYLFAFRLAYSGKAVHRISRLCGQQAFFEGHVHALNALGGVPTGQVRYDNLTPAVKKVIFRSRSREENPRWTNFLNVTTVSEMAVPEILPGTVEGGVPVYRLNLEKRRRAGHSGRFESRNLTDSSGRIVTEALEATARARALLARLDPQSCRDRSGGRGRPPGRPA